MKHAEIERQRLILPSVVFAQEYLAEYVDRGAAKIKREWLKIDNTKKPVTFYMGVDLAISQKETADYTALVVIGLTEDKEVVVVDAFRDRMTFVNIGAKVIEYANKLNPKVIAIENNQAQAWLVQELKRNTTLNVVGMRADRDKVIRFQPVEARYERREVFHYGTLPPEFTEELLSFTGTAQDKHDDYVDALGYAFASIKKTPGVFT
jgi:predicted phage terminase large subunit-like protein